MLNVFSVFDEKAAAYLPPLFFLNIPTAIRAFLASAQDASHEFHRFASDYTLFHLGTFDEKDASFSVFPSPVSLGKASEFLSRSEAKTTG